MIVSMPELRKVVEARVISIENLSVEHGRTNFRICVYTGGRKYILPEKLQDKNDADLVYGAITEALAQAAAFPGGMVEVSSKGLIDQIKERRERACQG